MNIVKGALMFYTQRVDGRPFVNCNMYAGVMVLRWMGYDCPKDYGMTLRVASGVPVEPGLGTSVANWKQAIAKELPNAPLMYPAIMAADLYGMLPRAGVRPYKNRHKPIARIYCRMELLPTRLRRHVGKTWIGLHAITIAHTRTCNGEDEGHLGHANKAEVWWMDPMGRPADGYAGEWAVWEQVVPAMFRNSEGAVRTTLGIKNTAA